jgi:hypothetical protein
MNLSRRLRFILLASFLILAALFATFAQNKIFRTHAQTTSGAPVGQTIWLKASNDNYVSVHTDASNAPLDASASQVQTTEEFKVADAGNGLIALQALANNNYVSARTNQDVAPLNASVNQVQNWEQFNWIAQSSGTVVLQSAANNNYVSAKGDQLDTPLEAVVTEIRGWEQFRWGQVGATVHVPNPVKNQVGITSGTPDFGPNVLIFDPTKPDDIQSQLDTVFRNQESNQFGPERYALLFKPGTYSNNVHLGFYTQALGLGLMPDDVTINGTVDVTAGWMGGNATQNFWRGAENMAVKPPSGSDTWAVSQAAPFRRMDVQGDINLSDGGWASGGFLADSNVSGQVNSGSQQQWLSRNDQIGGWNGGVWNMVFVGTSNAPDGSNFLDKHNTVVDQAPVIREKPFLYIDSSGNYQVFVPALRTNAQGTSWASGQAQGTSMPINTFYIAKPGDSADTINSALTQGLNLLFTPGIYHLDNTIQVTRPDTVVLGLGIATLVPDNGITAMNVADVNGVSIAGLLFDAGSTSSPVLLQVGDGSSQDHSADPALLSDVFFRIGGAGVGQAQKSLVVNSNNVILDDLWLWRADHSNGVGWNTNTAANGLIVNGDNVTAYGLFVEHYQEYQVIWNGNGGRTYFFQNELPYDPPDQSSWSHDGVNGYAAYKVDGKVKSHEAWGVGSYCYFSTNPNVVEENSFKAPNTPGVKFHSLVTVSLGGVGKIKHIINGTGGGSNEAYLASYP